MEIIKRIHFHKEGKQLNNRIINFQRIINLMKVVGQHLKTRLPMSPI